MGKGSLYLSLESQRGARLIVLILGWIGRGEGVQKRTRLPTLLF